MMFTEEEQERIDREVKAYQEKAREAEIQAEIQNRICDAKNGIVDNKKGK